MYKAELTFSRTEDGKVRVVWHDHEKLDATVVADSAEEALKIFAEHGDWEGQWLDAEQNELSTPTEPSTLGLASRVAIASDTIRQLIAEALEDGALLRIDYRDGENVYTTNRLIRPDSTYALGGFGGSSGDPATDMYLRSYDYGRSSQRTFRIDRIERAELAERP